LLLDTQLGRGKRKKEEEEEEEEKLRGSFSRLTTTLTPSIIK